VTVSDPDPGRLDREQVFADLSAASSANAPHFARLRVLERGLERDLLFGTETRWLGGTLLLDWRVALHTEVLFGCEEGDDYEIGEGADRVSGTVLERSFVDGPRGTLSVVRTDRETFVRDTVGRWQLVPRASTVPPPPTPESDGSRGDPLVDVALDSVQRAVVELPAGRRVLVLGEAGHGKTTVALHRLAHLRRAARSRFRAAVVVPTEGLRRVVEAALVRLGAPDADAFTFDQFAARQARWAFPGIPRRESQHAPAAVSTLKRSPALRAILPRVALAAERRKLRARREDLLHLFGDRALLESLGEASALVGPGVLADVLEHTHLQFGEIGEREWAHVVDPERLRTVDGRSLDEGTAAEDAGTIDPEDYAVLFELDRLRSSASRQKPRTPRPYDCIVLDEAQELSPLELALLGRCLAPSGDLIVAGDAEQQVDPAAYFGGWDTTMAELGASTYDRTVLAMSYRCPMGVTRLAREVLAGGGAPAPATAGDGEDDSVQRFAFDGDGRAVGWLADTLRALRDREPRASFAVIVRTPATVRLLARALRRGLGVRAALDGDFPPRGMVAIAAVRDIKGLEFDHVFVPDASAAAYLDTPGDRRALYVAVTRATHTLSLATGEDWSALLPAGQAGR
jgi:hypothetical protein